MPEEATSPVSTQQKWSAATAKDRIAIVTTDAALDARIRAALRDEKYEFVTVPDFVAHQDELTDTILCIQDARRKDSERDLIRYFWKSDFWNDYAVIGIVTPDDSKGGLFFPYSEYDFALMFTEDFIPEEFAEIVKRMIKALREPDDGKGLHDMKQLKLGEQVRTEKQSPVLMIYR